MKRFYYCPSCGKEQIVTDPKVRPYHGEETILNIRDGYGRPITHYKCECGNYLAGSMDLSGFDDSAVGYAKSVIQGYQADGHYIGRDKNAWLETAKKVYDTMHRYPNESKGTAVL